MHSGSERFQLSAAYFLYFITLGLFGPYFPVYLRERGLSGVQIGWVLALSPVLKIFVPPILGALADRARGPRFWGMVTAWAALSSLALVVTLSGNSWALIFSIACYCAATAPVMALLDSATLHFLQRTQQGRFGYVRLWGSLGFVLSSCGLGLLYTDLPAQIIAASLIGAHLVFALFITGARIEDAPLGISNLFTQYRLIASLLRNPVAWLLLSTIFLNRVASSPYSVFYTVFLQDIGLGGDVVALTWGLAVGVEVVTMLFVDRLIDRLGAGRVLALGVGLEAVRWLALSTLHTKTALLLIAPWHGLAFGLLYVASVREMTRIAPRELRTLGQGLAAAAAGGGQVIGFIGSGYLFQRLGGGGLFLAAALVGLRRTNERARARILEKEGDCLA
ncbi:MAG: MFS transporter [Pyrinomonadaceae bacterium]